MFIKLKEFIESTPNAKICAFNVSQILEAHGFKEVKEKDNWNELACNKKGIYVKRGNSIIAIRLPSSLKRIKGVLTHSDSPHFKVKTNPEILQNGYVKLNVEPYGGAIYYSWLDKPLSICGSLMCKSDKLKNWHVNFDSGTDYQVFIPSQAIHINRDVNSSNSLNPQKDMLPVAGLGDSKCFFNKLKEILQIRDDILAYDLSLYNPEPVKLINLGNSSVVMGPRLDNLSSVYSSLNAFVLEDFEKDAECAQVLTVFNSEEIGSETYEGAAGNFLPSVLERVCELYKASKYEVYADSMFLSIDAAHAVHPNASEKSDPTNVVKFGQGIVIKHNTNYANELGLEAYIKRICNNKNINVQDFHSRSDMRCGSTLGNISMGRCGINTLDIGIPMLAMHSAVETINMDDIHYLESLLYYYFQ